MSRRLRCSDTAGRRDDEERLDTPAAAGVGAGGGPREAARGVRGIAGGVEVAAVGESGLGQ